MIADGVEHHEGDLHGGGRIDLAGAGLDEVGTRSDGDVAGQTDLVVGAELAGLEDHFQACITAGLLDGGDLVEDEVVVAAVEPAAADDHVDLVGTLADGEPGVGDLDVAGGLAAGEGGGDGGDLDAAVAEGLLRDLHQGRVHADGGHRGQAWEAVVRVHGLVAHLLHLAGRVGTLQRGEVDHAEGELHALHLGLLLDAARLDAGHALLDAHLVDGGAGAGAGDGGCRGLCRCGHGALAKDRRRAVLDRFGLVAMCRAFSPPITVRSVSRHLW